MAGNHTIIEVKPATVRAEGIRKDIGTLDTFVSTVGYRRAIYLLYGDEADLNLIDRLVREAPALNPITRVELWLHSEFGQPAVHAATIIDK